MTVQPAQPPARQSHLVTPPGWYPDVQQHGMQRYWDGARWTANVAPIAPAYHPQAAYPQQPQIVVVQQPGGQGRYVSGMTSGQNLAHGILSVCTLGLWLPVWWLMSRMGRRRIR